MCPLWLKRFLGRKEEDKACPWPPFWRARRTAGFSPLTVRILAVNVMALAILVGSLLYLGQYQDRLILAELDGLTLQARMSASAVAEGAVVLDREERNILSPLLARLMIRRLVEASETRTRLFDMDDTLLADSRILLDPAGKVQARELPPPASVSIISSIAMPFFDVIDRITGRNQYPVYPEEVIQEGEQYDIVKRAKNGMIVTQVWSLPDGGLLLSAAAPVQRYKQVLGAVMLTKPDAKIAAAIQDVRHDILKIFGVTLLITLLLSIYLARAIARPLKLLAKAAERVRIGQTQMVGLSGMSRLLNQGAIPDFSERHDEIGDLSVALREMTQALAKRIGAIENFAADVAHEIKNPLTSLRSAVETAGKIKDPERQQKLMQVIRDDVDRLDRLITDISVASRLDAELTRDEASRVDITQMLQTLVGFYDQESGSTQTTAKVVIDPDMPKNLIVSGVESRLVQVMQNLISNALSFTSVDKHVFVTAQSTRDHYIEMIVEDMGGGIPEGKLEAIFDRFYSERPKSEKFGTHSGLGLSISKQIVEAHHGSIWAENRTDEQGQVFGARFIVRLPLFEEE
ncbi:MAG: HAMP domain-containing protein [Proteobacteria bacterium]|nr:stimulus-sensing domain-containing protein [Alphaproteobacteria bacterium]NCC03727.1 HAMP domain-containing protein [Pseudomonadota bacterium]